MPSHALPAGWRLEAVPEVDSTNAELLRRAEQGEPEGLALRANVQTAGRGRRGRPWSSPVGNLYLSVLIDADPATAGQIGFAAALALLDAVELEADRAIPALRCKWPNDLLLDGKKTAGLLLEAVPGQDQVVVGIGVNVVPMDVSEALYPIGSLAELKTPFDLDRLSARLCVSLQSWLETWRTVGFIPIRNAWLKRAYGVNEPIVVRLPTENLEGTFLGLSSDGALLLEHGAGERIVPAGDVFFAGPAET